MALPAASLAASAALVALPAASLAASAALVALPAASLAASAALVALPAASFASLAAPVAAVVADDAAAVALSTSRRASLSDWSTCPISSSVGSLPSVPSIRPLSATFMGRSIILVAILPPDDG